MNQKIVNLLENKGENYIFPFFWQHGEEEKTLREYMKVIDNCHIGAVCVESRPHPDFVGAGWWRDMDIILDEARKRGMKVWILDDSHFPTGYANGAMEKKEAVLCRQSLVYQTVECPKSGEIMILSLAAYQEVPPWQPNMMEQYLMQGKNIRQFNDDELLSLTAVKVNGDGKNDLIDILPLVTDGTLSFRVPEGQWRIYICYLTRNRGPHRDYINMLDKASCRILIDTVYEPHYERYAKDFGTTIAGFFSDEPELGNGHLYETGKKISELEDQAWSREVQEELKQRWRGDFTKLLPLIWEEDFCDMLKAKVRFDYMDIVTRTVERDFSMQLGNWCRDHGVQYIGHIIEDNHQHTRTGSSLGHFFRGLSGQDMAGIDNIGGQVLPQGEQIGRAAMGDVRDGEFYHYVLGKLGASAAAIDPLKKGRSMCEIFGNYGWEEGVRLEKYLTDHFLVRGINHFVPHAFSPKEFPDPDCPPHFYAQGHNPQYRHFGALMQYMNRMCYLLNDGRHIAPVAILYNAEADWTGKNMFLQKPAMELYDHQIDYDIIPADVFVETTKYQTRLSKVLAVGKQEYQALIIPKGQFITSETAKALATLRKNGCIVYFIDSLPEGICNYDGDIADINECEVVSLDELVCHLIAAKVPEILISPANNRVRYYHYKQENDIYFFTNEGTKAYIGDIIIPRSEPFYSYNAWGNRVETLAGKDVNGQTQINVKIEPNQSLLVVFDEAEERKLPLETLSGTVEEWNDDWVRSICTSIQYPAFEQPKKVTLPDNLAAELPDFSGFVRYQKIYDRKESAQQTILEITDAYEGVEVFVNNQTAGIQIVPPFQYNLTDLLINGKNQIVIEVATTLERQMAKIPDPIRMYMGLGEKKPICPSGINGELRLIYAEKK
ncbi:hypothetical protein DWX43_21610 [Clostridium sp. AF19-22AC]|uniref:glycosyl hydrolase n=1 Tax=Clostridia TaxID=186801 RepID=UPI000E469150|nr:MULTISPECIES: glycosyl hydrolase [Clostridia]RHR22564.1 hypothetical protein DWX43_21610 [Clostridium sp. AF19-22AC]